MVLRRVAAFRILGKLRLADGDAADRLPAPPRVAAYQMEIFYDKPRDTLYISLGGPRASIAFELVGGTILIRYVPQTTIIVGLTIPNLSTLAERPVMLPILITMQTMPEG